MNDGKAVIFDGDGTLWRPIGQGKEFRPDGIYSDESLGKDTHLGLGLIDGVSELITSLRNRGYRIFVVSAHPRPGSDALHELELKIVTLGIKELVDAFFCSDGSDRDGKVKVIRSIVSEFGLNSRKTHMIGDSYYYDYEAGKKAGVNSWFIKNEYCKQPLPLPNGTLTIDDVTEFIPEDLG